MNCSQVAVFQIMPALCVRTDRGKGLVNQMWTGLERERGVPKIPKFVRTSFMDDPLINVNCSVLIDGISSPSKSVVGIDF